METQTNIAQIDIRPLRPEDATAYRAIRLEAMRHNPEAFASTYEIEAERPLTWFAQRQSGAEIFGAFRGGDLLGIAGYIPQQGAKTSHKAVLVGMYVQPAARGHGIGRRLVEAVIGHARSRVELLQLSVVGGNEAARRLYAGLGFMEYGMEKNALKHDGRYYDEILMVKMLN
jgi:ribosomal protein S18 acetylase RimI-like enzyme